MSAIKEEVGVLQAVNQSREAIIKEIESTRESRIWKLSMVFVPIILTVGLGAVLNAKIDTAGKELSARLALREEFYKRKFTVYEDAHKQMIEVLGALETLRIQPDNSQKRADAADALLGLYQVANVNGLYMSSEVADGLMNVWSLGANAKQLNNSGSVAVDDVTQEIGRVEDVMKRELEGSIGPI